MASPLETKLNELAAIAAAAHGVSLVCARLSGSGKYLTLQVLLEKPDGSSPTVDECTTVSRTLGAQLDVAEVIKGRYVLEVGSAGLERPLMNAADYQRFMGRQIKVHLALKQVINGQQTGSVVGYLTAADANGFTLNPKDKSPQVTLPYGAVRNTHLSPAAEELEAFMAEAKRKSAARAEQADELND